MKTVLLIPGYHENLKSRDYASLIKAIEAAGYKVKFIPIIWARTTIDNWVSQLELEYAKHEPAHTVLAGFSFGAMTAFVAASRQNPSELWLFSLSGYFAEDIASKDMNKQWLKNIGKRRQAAFSRLDYKALASKIRCKTLLFVGRTELDMWPTMRHRSFESPKYLHKATFTIIDNVGHDIADPRYIAAVSQEL